MQFYPEADRDLLTERHRQRHLESQEAISLNTRQVEYCGETSGVLRRGSKLVHQLTTQLGEVSSAINSSAEPQRPFCAQATS